MSTKVHIGMRAPKACTQTGYRAYARRQQEPHKISTDGTH